MPKISTAPTLSKASEAPEGLKVYVALGVELRWKERQSQAQGVCPFCQGTKLYIDVETGMGDCKTASCDMHRGCNAYGFIRLLHEKSEEATPDDALSKFAAEKGLLNGALLRSWGVCRSFINDMWLVPGYQIEADGTCKVSQLYRWMRDDKGNMRWLPTPTLNHHLMGYGSFDPAKKDVYFCEGLFDGACLKETLRYTRRIKGGDKTSFALESDESLCLLEQANVLAAAGCGVFLPSWAQVLDGKRVFFCYDNDRPKVEPNGTYHEPASYAGMRNACLAVAGTGVKVEEMHYLKWSRKEEDIDHDPSLPDGHDVRDHVVKGSKSLKERASKLGTLLSRFKPAPTEWLQAAASSNDISILPCNDWEELITAWKKCMEWMWELDVAISVMFSAVASTPAVGDQLWIRLMSPASTGKTVLAEAIATARRWVVAKSSLRGFSSAAKGEEGEDLSLVNDLRGKTFILKDGDLLLKAPDRDRILAEARDIYDGTYRPSYRARKTPDYNNLRITWILCGTASLHALDTSELGERFLNCTIIKKIERKHERAVAVRAGWRQVRNSGQESNCKADSQYDPDLLRAMQLTGGYVDYLRCNALGLIEKLQQAVTEEQVEYVCDLAEFVAHMRCRPSRSQDDTTERELSARLTSQLIRLMMFLTVVMQRGTVDKEVLARVRKVAVDTCEGKTLTFCQVLMKVGDEGCESRALARATPYSDEDTRRYLKFLRAIGVVETVQQGKGHVTPKYRITEDMKKLYRLVIEGKQ